MLRILPLLLSVMLMFGITGCSENTLLDPTDPVTLTLWHVYGEQSDSPMNQLVSEFNATVGLEKGIVVSVTNVTSTSKISAQLLESQAENAGAPPMPDLFSCHTTTAVNLGAKNLVDFNEWFSEKELKEYVPEFLGSGMKDGRLVVFPVSKSSYALFLNGSQFERFSADTGATYDNLATWEGFFDVAQKYYEWSDGKPFCAMDYLIRHVEFDILSRVGSIEYTADGWYHTDDPAVYESWMMFARPLVQGHIAVADLYANTQVMTGEILAGIGSTAAVAYYNDTVTYPDNTSEPTNLQVLPLPKSGGAAEYMPQTGVGLAAYKTDQKAEAAAEFVRWFTEGQRNLDFVAQTGYMPVQNDAYTAIENYTFQSDAYKNLFNAIRIMREEYTAVVRPDFDGFYTKTDALYEGLRQMQALLRERADNGEDPDILAEETWNFFKSIQ